MFQFLKNLFIETNPKFEGKLSVIIPCFNSHEYLDRCLRSVIGQTYRNIEIICIDDRSQDSTLEILKKYSNLDSRIKVIAKDKNLGSGNSRNMAISIATGDVVTFVDSDDYLSDNNFYQECLDKLQKCGSDCLLTPYLRRKGQRISQDRVFDKKITTSTEAVNLYLARKFGTHASCGKFFKKKTLCQARYVEVGYSQDVIFMAEALDAAKTITVYKRPGYVYFTDNFSATRPSVISDQHIFSSFRLLVEVLHFQKQKTLEGKTIDLNDFLKLWNRDHGARLKKFINDRRILSKDLQAMSKTLFPIYDLLNQVVEDQSITRFFLNYENKDKEENLENLTPFFLRGLNYLSKVVDELK